MTNAHHPTITGLCAALLPPEHGGPPSAELARAVAGYLQALPRPHHLGLRATAAGLDAAAMVLTGRRLATLDAATRARVLDRLAARPLLEPAVTLGKSAVLLVHGTDAFHADLAERSTREPPARPDPVLHVTAAAEWPSRSRCDVVVIGSGASGAMVARTLARAGADVVVVEEGRRFRVEEFRTGHPRARFTAAYRDAGATAAIGRPPVLLPLGRAVGGSTLVNSGTCYRPPGRVLRRWRDEAGLDLADAAALSSHLDDVEATLGVAPVPDAVMGRNGTTMLAGAEALGWRAGPLLRNAPGCGGCCQCSIGCPRNAKAGVHMNALPQACAAGARIVAEARVEQVVHERGRTVGVRARRGDGSLLTIAAERVVVAAGATETPPLLVRSGLGRHPAVGRNLALHPAVGVAGRFDEPVVSWRGVLQSASLEEFHDRHGILVEATATPPGMGSMSLPGHGRELLDELATADQLATLGAMVGDRPGGRVVGVGRQTLIRYRLGDDDARRLVLALGVMGRVLFAAGAREVLTGVARRPRARNEAELEAALADCDPRRLKLAAFHPTGTVAAGGDPQRYPVDPNGALRGVEGVWVADASVLPTCPEVNPQVTIMAVALALAERMATGIAPTGRDRSPRRAEAIA